MNNQKAINWASLEKFIGEDIPQCVKAALLLCGFDSIASLGEINEKWISEVEKTINNNNNHMEKMKQLKCCFSEYYKGLNRFEFLPGHVALLMSLPKFVCAYRSAQSGSVPELNGRFSFILEELIRTAESNLSKAPNQAVYSDEIKCFATYIFLLSGRSCYEFIRKNLPLPSVETVSKCKITWKVVKFFV